VTALAPELIAVPVDGPARAVFTTRRGGTSRGPWASLNLAADGGDAPEAVRANRRALADALGVPPGRVTMVRQVHGADVLRVDAPPRPGLFDGDLLGWDAADALASESPGSPLVVMGADCPPVLAWRRDRPAVAAAHAGWRGLVAGVVGRSLASLGDAGAVGAAIGPGIGPCCYEVSREVRERFAAAFGPEVVRDRAVDLAASVRVALRAAGVPDAAIVTVEACTRCEHERFFSHRGSGGTCGRQAGVVWAEAV
jgi:polyphenol oxidase